MNITIPSGGFCAIEDKTRNLTDIKHQLESRQAKTLHFESDRILLAAFTQNPDQGLWTDGINGVAWDMDLTNMQMSNPSEEDKGRYLLQLYEQHGMAFVDRLRGAFAFAIWDGRLKQIFIFTDFYGLKPVVYTEQNGCFAAASRIRYLLWMDPSLKEINPDAIFHYLFFQAICSPLTIYKSIKKLEPGKVLHKQGDQVSHLTHYDIKYTPDHSLSQEDWKIRIREQIQKAVGVFVPLSPYEKTGCFLSGGTDSSSVAGYYTQISGKAAKTFSIGFDDPRYNELDYARIAAERFKTDYHEYYVTPADVMSLIEQIPRIYDEPFGNASVIPAFYCARHASEKGIDILLGGDGGDEIFGGNERYVTNLVFQKYLAIPRAFRKTLFEPLLNLMPDFSLFYKAKRYVRRANIPNPQRFYSYNLLAELDPHTIFQEDFIRAVNLNSFMDIAENHYSNAAPADDTDRLLYLDMKFTITDNDIQKVTRMVEAAGLRVRYPLLDRDLVDFTCTIPPTLKVKWKKNRYLFKEAMKGFLPDEIITKSKHGMGLPVTPWFKQERQMKALLYDILFSGTPAMTRYIKPEFIQKMKTAFETDTSTYYGDNLWVFLILEMWLNQGG
ncbi:MAG: asparagine synthase-related protein [Desulfobacter postgatei]|uniref:asparagine synthetase B family protein n=1 Tax=Desulfobacter postgatei TaxID=2293 RepID=UPI0023F49852|nr:asparagine synthase-related protein [Desulfobacter postgatei]MDD4275242.1 asparagine synthase-related protein [Desulfobacter postgatei]